MIVAAVPPPARFAAAFARLTPGCHLAGPHSTSVRRVLDDVRVAKATSLHAGTETWWASAPGALPDYLF